MSEPFIGEIRMVSFGFPPRGWAYCNGQLLRIAQNLGLFHLLQTTFGGDGVETFALPDLRGRVPVNIGEDVTLGQKGGENSITLTANQIPGHAHAILGSANQGTSTNPAGLVPAQKPRGGPNVYGSTPNATLSSATLTPAAGSGAPHENRQPSLAVNFIIAIQGIFPL